LELAGKIDPSFLPWPAPCPPSLFFFFHDHPTKSSNSHPQPIHVFLVDNIFRFKSLRVAGVLEFCYWGSAASALALRFSSGTFEISVQPSAHALVMESGRSPDVTVQTHHDPAHPFRPVGEAAVCDTGIKRHCCVRLARIMGHCMRFAAAGRGQTAANKHIVAFASASSPTHSKTLPLIQVYLELQATDSSRIFPSFYKLESPSLRPSIINSLALHSLKESASLGDTSGLGFHREKFEFCNSDLEKSTFQVSWRMSIA